MLGIVSPNLREQLFLADITMHLQFEASAQTQPGFPQQHIKQRTNG